MFHYGKRATSVSGTTRAKHRCQCRVNNLPGAVLVPRPAGEHSRIGTMHASFPGILLECALVIREIRQIGDVAYRSAPDHFGELLSSVRYELNSYAKHLTTFQHGLNTHNLDAAKLVRP